MGEIASQITSLTIVYSTVYSDADQRKHQSSSSLAFVREIHRGPVNSPHKWPVTRKMFPFDDVIMSFYFLKWIRHDGIASLKPSDAIWRPTLWPILVQTMSFRLLSTQPLPETMLIYWWLDCREDTSMKFDLNFKKRGMKRPSAKCRPLCVGKLTIIGSDNGLLPGRRQAII